MHISDNIRKHLSFVLLLLFAVSAAPKVLFHEALAGHTDGQVCLDTDKSAPHFHQPTFHCSFDDLVVSSPYLSAELKAATVVPAFALPAPVGFTPVLLSAAFLHNEGRGPPPHA